VYNPQDWQSAAPMPPPPRVAAALQRAAALAQRGAAAHGDAEHIHSARAVRAKRTKDNGLI